jgi:hypothetical protein
MQQEADRRGESLHVVAAQAWRIARERITKASTLDDVLSAPSATAYRGGNKVAQIFTLPPDVEADIQREAARLDLTVSRVLEAAWLLAHDTMRLTSSLLH